MDRRGLLAASSGSGLDEKPASSWSSTLSSLLLAHAYTRADLVRPSTRTRVRLGIATVSIVVTFACVLQSAITVSPIIFLRLSETQAGEADAVLTSETSSDAAALSRLPLPTLNYSGVREAHERWGGSPFAGVAPRWSLLAAVARTPTTPNAGAQSRSSAFVLAIDSEVERSIGLGRAWGRRALGPAECYATTSVLSDAGVRGGAGEQITLTFSPGDILAAASAAAAAQTGQAVPTTGASGANAAIVAALLAAAGVDLANVQLTVGAGTALEVALIAAGVPPALAANLTAGIGVIPGITVDLTPLLTVALAGAANALAVSSSYTVVEELRDPGGKFSTLLGNVVVLEARFVADLLQTAVSGVVDQLAAILTPIAQGGANGAGVAQLLAALARLQALVPTLTYAVMQQYALEIDVMLATPQRNALYLTTDANSIDSGVTRYTNALMGDMMGPTYPVVVSNPLSAALQGVTIIALFLQQVFTIVVVVLGLLGAVVIYALILGDVESRTYELGMLRALGMKHLSLTALLTLQTAVFVVPGIAIGVILSSLLYVAIVATMQWYAAITLPWAMPPAAWAFGLSLGLCVPAIAVVVPVRRALSSRLRDALDMSRTAANDVTIRVMHLAALGLSPQQTVLAVMLVVVGFITFYAVPLSFLFNDLGLFLGILTGILLAMLVGMTMLSQALQASLELLVMGVLLLFTRERKRLSGIVFKNLYAHRPRNSKTSYLISITVGFLVFASAMFALQSRSIVTNVRLFLGADVVVLTVGSLDTGGNGAISGNLATLSLPQAEMTSFLTQRMASGRDVVGFTYISASLGALPYVRRTPLGNLVGIPSTRTRVYGIQRNFLEVAFNEYSVATDASTQGLPGGQDQVWALANPVQALYAGAGTLRLPIESALAAPPAPSATGSSRAPAFLCNATVPDALSASFIDANGSSVAWSSVWEALPDYSTISNTSTLWARVQSGVCNSVGNTSLPSASNSVGDASFTAACYAQACGIAGGCAAGAVDPTTATSDAYAPPVWPFAYMSYDYCMAACSSSRSKVSSNVTYAAAASPFYGSLAAAAAGSVAYAFPSTLSSLYVPAALPFRTVNNASSVATAAGVAAYLPCTCHEGRFESPRAAVDRITTAYVRYVDVIMSEGLRGAASLSVSTPLALRPVTRDPTTTLSLTRAYLAKARVQVSKMPSFFFSSYSSSGGRSPVLLRMQDASNIFGDIQSDYTYILQYAAAQRAGSTVSASTTSTRNGSAFANTSAPASFGAMPMLRPAWPLSPTWFNTSASWAFSSTPANCPLTASTTCAAAAVRDVTTTSASLARSLMTAFPGVYASPAATKALSNASFAATVPTAALAATAQSIFFTLDISTCALMSGVQLLSLSLPAAALQALPVGTSVRVQLFAITDAAARGYALIFTTTVPIKGVATVSLSLPISLFAATQGGFSSRWWGIAVSLVTTGPQLLAANVSVPVPTFAFQLSAVAPAACAGDRLAIPDDVPSLPKQRLLIKLRAGTSDEARSAVVNGLRSIARSPLVQVQDTTSLLASTSVATLGLDAFFAFVAAIALILCFFAAWMSFSANVSESSVEYGIMRSLGFTSAQVVTLYVLEAVTVVMTAFLLGTSVGLLVAITLTLQFNLFLELPFQFVFPTTLFVLTFCGCLALACVASYVPARALGRIPIAGVLKGRTSVT